MLIFMLANYVLALIKNTEIKTYANSLYFNWWQYYA
jgi:hypothetical protein